MAQGFQPVALDALPIPQSAQPAQYQPANLTPVPTEQPAGAGYMGKGGQIADIGANFLQGWMQGKQKAAQHKLAQAQQSVEGTQYGFQIAQQNATQVMNDPSSTPDQKQKAEAARQQAWKAYLDVAQQYAEPEKKQGKGGAKGAAQGIGEHLKNAFGTQDPHIFSQATLALLRTTGPPALQKPSTQEQLAQRDLTNAKKIDNAIDALADAHKNNAPPEQIAKLEQQVRDVQGQVKPEQTPVQQLQNNLAQAAIDEQAGKPVNDATKKQLQAAGYDPKPVTPNMFQRIDDKGMMWVDSIDPDTGKKIGSTQIGKTRIAPDAREETQQVFQENLKQLGQLLKQAHPDWTDQQINQAKSEAMLSEKFGIKPVKVAPGMTPKNTQTAISKALGKVFYEVIDNDEDREKFKAIALGGEKGMGGGGFGFRNDLADKGWLDRNLNPFSSDVGTKLYHGMTEEEASQYDAKIRNYTRQILSKQGYTDEQVDAMVPKSMVEARLDDTPGSTKQTAKKSDVQAFADTNNMTYDQAVKAIEEQGYEVEK